MQEAYWRCCESYASIAFLIATLSWENSSYKQACFAKWDYVCYWVLSLPRHRYKHVEAFFQLQMNTHRRLKEMYDHKRRKRTQCTGHCAVLVLWNPPSSLFSPNSNQFCNVAWLWKDLKCVVVVRRRLSSSSSSSVPIKFPRKNISNDYYILVFTLSH
jgi:hypothetical protein